MVKRRKVEDRDVNGATLSKLILVKIMFYLAAYARHTLRFTREQNKHNGKQDIIISATW